MFTSADYRAFARNVLRGKWIIAALTAFIASLIGASLIGGGGAFIDFNEEEIRTVAMNFSEEQIQLFSKIVWGVFVYSIVGCIISLVIGGAGQLGYARFNLQLADSKEAKLSDLFSQFERLGDGFLMMLLCTIYLIGWSFLFVVPAIVKSFSYAMTPYILYENPYLSVNEAITESRRIMDGNKFDLFLLRLSFIGWELLASIPAAAALYGLVSGQFGLLPLFFVTVIANKFVAAYAEAAQAAFYRQITWKVPQPIEESENGDMV